MSEPPAAGFLPVDKPAGPTSHDVVAAARRILGERRIGHTGTLDPFASGLLLLVIGSATRLAEYTARLPKTYEAVMRLGRTTDTDDRTGAVLAETDEWRHLEPGTIRQALEQMVGTVAQVPPMYSARKVGGRRLYLAARKGEEVIRPAAEVHIHSIDIRQIAGPEVTFEVTCSSGTYIRAIARDAGANLGVGGSLVALRRTAIGPHRVENAVPVDCLDDPHRVAEAWIPPAAALAHLPAIRVDSAAARSLSHGQAIEVGADAQAGTTIVLSAGALVAVGEVAGGVLRPRKVLAS